MRWMVRFLVIALLIFCLLTTSCEAATRSKYSSSKAVSLPSEPRLPGETQRQSSSLAGRAYHADLGQLGYAEPTRASISKDSLTRGEPLSVSVQNDDFVYRYYYVSINGKWEKFSFPQQAIGSSNWIAFSAGASIDTTQLQEGDNYVVMYSCSKAVKGFDCHGNKWQIHKFDVLPKPEISQPLPKEQPQEPDCGSDQECPLNFKCEAGKCVEKPKPLEPAPEVFNTKFYQGPVRADPDDLLLIPGYGFKQGVIAVYKQVSDNPANLQPPSIIPNKNTVSEGKLYVASVASDSINVLLPEVMKARQAYAIWIKNPNGEWSEPVLINDPRPLWLSPDQAYATKQFASLPREIKVIGRNLNGGSSPKIRLSGPTNYDLVVVDDGNPSTTIEHYAAKASLPSTLQAGTYKVQFSRDGAVWIDLPSDISFTVLPDPVQKQSFDISKNGCSPDDGLDDTGCIVQAIAAAKAAGGGEVFIPAGTWHLKDPTKSTDPSWAANGIVVPLGIDLIGVGSKGDKPSKIVQTLDWKRPSGNSWDNVITVFSLLGNNRINGIYFHSDGFIFNPADPQAKGPSTDWKYISLGKLARTVQDPTLIENIVISNNKFSGLNDGKVLGMYSAIGDWGMSSRHIFIANNEFQAYKDALTLYGIDKSLKHRIADSVIAYNTFYPGDYVEGTYAGTIASEMHGTNRVDFSNNHADGKVNNGWRAGFFWSNHNTNEMLLISQNKATCTGNKAGDGESFVFDDNGNVHGFSDLQKVLSSTSTSITVDAAWKANTPNYYNEHWVNIVDGKGLGQSRRIVSYTPEKPATITVFPAWDVVPDSSSLITITRITWNAYMVDNVVDIRGCNPNPILTSGVFGMTGAAADFTIEGNQLFDAAGINSFGSGQRNTGVAGEFNGWATFAGEIRNNYIEGENKFPESQGGIKLWYGSEASYPSPVLDHNILVSHNIIKKSDDDNGAIALRPAYTRSQLTPYQLKGIAVFHNIIEDVPAFGIKISEKYVWNTVLHKNIFKGVQSGKEIYDAGTDTVKINLFCGDGLVTGSEVCDDGSAGKCAYGLQSCLVCSVQCNNPSVAGITSYCGDNKCDLQHESTASCQQDCGNACAGSIAAQWSGEGNSLDSVGKYTAAPQGNVLYATGKTGQAFSLAGNSYLNTADLSWKTTDSFTFSLWVNPSQLNSNDVLFGKPFPEWEYSLMIPSNGFLRFTYFNSNGMDELNLQPSTPSLQTGQWTHLAIVYDGATGVGKMFVDGVLVAQANRKNQAPFQDRPNPLQIGAGYYNGKQNYFTGLIDEFTIWNKPLTDIEIQAIHVAGSKGTCKA